MKKFRKFLLLATVLLVLCLFSACGAVVSTDMMVDEEFAGSRVITLTISDEDMGKVTGGSAALEEVITNNIPDAMTYAVNEGEGNTVITFTIAYENLEDYQKKVAAIIEAGITEEEREKGDNLVPEVIYERNESYFKKGLILQENFTSVDLLDWFREGLRTAAIISQSESDWFENGSHVVTIEDTEYSFNYNRQIDVNAQDNACLSSCNVSTVVSLDNTMERTITMSANKDTIAKLSEKGCELESYLKELAPEGVEFSAENGDYESEYTFVIHAASAEELVSKTGAILQTEGNAFAVNTSVDPARLGYAKITVSETLDASYYLDVHTSVSSSVSIYSDTTVMKAVSGEEELRYNSTEEGFSYMPKNGQQNDFELDWQIGFEEISLDITPSGAKKISVEMDCKLSEVLSAELKTSAIDRIKSLVPNQDVCKTSENGVVLTFSGEVLQVQKEINDMIVAATGVSQDASAAEADTDAYFRLTGCTFATASFFTDGMSYEVGYDFAPLFGKTPLTVEDQSGFLSGKYYQGGQSLEDGKKQIYASGSIDVYKVSPDIVGIIVAAVSLCLLVAGVILLLGGIKPFMQYLAHLKEVKKEKAAALQTQAVTVPQDAAVPEQTYAAPFVEEYPDEQPLQAAPQVQPVQAVPQVQPVQAAPQAVPQTVPQVQAEEQPAANQTNWDEEDVL